MPHKNAHWSLWDKHRVSHRNEKGWSNYSYKIILKNLDPHIMKKHIKVSNRLLELGITSICQWLSMISHMIEITVFYSFFIWVKKPSIHHSYAKMVRMRCLIIKWDKVLTCYSFIDKKCSCTWHIINIGDVHTIRWIGSGKKLLSHSKTKSFFTILYLCVFI